MTVETSSDGQHWEQAGQTEERMIAREREVLLHRIDFQTPRSGQYLRLRTAEPASSKSRTLLAEVEVWGENGDQQMLSHEFLSKDFQVQRTRYANGSEVTVNMSLVEQSLADIFVDMRGSTPGGSNQNQAAVPLRKEQEAVGHCVTATYLWCGAADVYAETGEKALLDALNRLWSDVTTHKMYVTGGVATLHQGGVVAPDVPTLAARFHPRGVRRRVPVAQSNGL